MTSVTLTVPDDVKSELKRFSWVNWSEAARENLLKKAKLEEFRERLTSKEEKELEKWAVETGRKLNKGAFRRLLSELSPKERRELTGE